MISYVFVFVSHIGDVQFIDYEYSGYNYLAYDIGNHFNEFAGKIQQRTCSSSEVAYKTLKGCFLEFFCSLQKINLGVGATVLIFFMTIMVFLYYWRKEMMTSSLIS